MRIRTIQSREEFVYGDVSTRPALCPDSDETLNKFDVTICVVTSNDGKNILDIIPFKHADRESVKNLLELFENESGKVRGRFNFTEYKKHLGSKK
jgi:hypothetical protein